MKAISTDELCEKLTPDVALMLAGVAAGMEAQVDRFDRPRRNFYPIDEQGSKFGIMPVILRDPPLLGLKVINIFPGNAAVRKPTHVGLYQLFSGKTGELLATMDENVLTGIRTAAMTAFATKHIASKLTNHIAIIGTGDQAEWHARMLGTLFKPTHISISGRTHTAGMRLADKLTQTVPSLEIAVIEAEHAVREATVICTATSSATPIVHRDWLGERAHINAIGAHDVGCAELDEAIFEDATCYTDDLPAFQIHCSEYLKLVGQGRPHPDRIYGLCEGHPPDDRTAGITLYKSFGTAIQDIVFAAYSAGINLHIKPTTDGD